MQEPERGGTEDQGGNECIGVYESPECRRSAAGDDKREGYPGPPAEGVPNSLIAGLTADPADPKREQEAGFDTGLSLDLQSRQASYIDREKARKTKSLVCELARKGGGMTVYRSVPKVSSFVTGGGCPESGDGSPSRGRDTSVPTRYQTRWSIESFQIDPPARRRFIHQRSKVRKDKKPNFVGFSSAGGRGGVTETGKWMMIFLAISRDQTGAIIETKEATWT
ncbi:hypothetical protein C8R43DRAFT_1112107 [Mycena crocata]|nr:hypothetical protein C8R43DRAFT_1112107 [Mycena crocata]